MARLGSFYGVVGGIFLLFAGVAYFITQIFSFYVELHYHIEHNALIRLSSFSGVEYLDVYIQQMDLNDIGLFTVR